MGGPMGGPPRFEEFLGRAFRGGMPLPLGMPFIIGRIPFWDAILGTGEGAAVGEPGGNIPTPLISFGR